MQSERVARWVRHKSIRDFRDQESEANSILVTVQNVLSLKEKQKKEEEEEEEDVKERENIIKMIMIRDRPSNYQVEIVQYWTC